MQLLRPLQRLSIMGGSSIKGEPARGPLPQLGSGEYRNSAGDLSAYRIVFTPGSERHASVITVSHHSAEERDAGWQHGEAEALMQPEDRAGTLMQCNIPESCKFHNQDSTGHVHSGLQLSATSCREI